MRRQSAPADEMEEDLDVPSDLMDLDETTPSSPPGSKRPRSKRNRNKPAG
jgi:hypothetical protein